MSTIGGAGQLLWIVKELWDELCRNTWTGTLCTDNLTCPRSWIMIIDGKVVRLLGG